MRIVGVRALITGGISASGRCPPATNIDHLNGDYGDLRRMKPGERPGPAMARQRACGQVIHSASLAGGVMSIDWDGSGGSGSGVANLVLELPVHQIAG